MAVTNHSSNSATASKVTSVSVTLDTISGDQIIVCIQLSSNNTVSTITDTAGAGGSSSTYTRLGGPQTNGTGLSVELWGATAAGTNVTNSISVTFSAKSTGVVEAADYGGVIALSNAAPNATGSSTTPDITISIPQAANSWAVASMGIASTGTISANIGNLRQSGVSGIGGALNDRPGDGSTGGTTVYGLENKITDSVSAAWACVVVELKTITNTIKCVAQDVANPATLITTLSSAGYSTTSGNIIVVTIGTSTNDAPSSITDTVGTTYSLQVTVNNGTGQRADVWTGTSAATNAANVVKVNYAAAQTYGFTVEEYSGVVSFGNTATNTGGSGVTSYTASITTQDPNNVVVGGLNTNATTATITPTANDGDAREIAKTGAVSRSIGGLDDNSATAQSITVAGTVSTSAGWSEVLLELRTAGAKPVPTRNLLGVGM